MGSGERAELSLALSTALAADQPRLAEIASIIACCDAEPPTLQDIEAELDDLAAEAPSADPSDVVRHVFASVGFAGDGGNYYHPDNSLIHRVLERRLGNPLSLAIVAAEISRLAGGDLRVVGFPGHVLLGDGLNPTRWFDPFLGGAVLNEAGCRSLLARMRPGEQFEPEMVLPSPMAEIAARMLNNLDVAYRQSGEVARLITVLELRLGLPGAGSGERRQLAHTLIAGGRHHRAVDVLGDLVIADPSHKEEYDLIIHRLQASRN